MQKELRIGTSGKFQFDGGLNYVEDSSVALNQSPYGGLLNMTLGNGGMPIKRKGQNKVYGTTLAGGKVKGIYANFKDKTVFVHDSKMYTQQSNSQPVEIYTGITGDNAFMFAYNGILYLLTGKEYLQYDGTTVKAVEPYVPRISMNRKPNGSESEVDESWNMLGTGFRETFNGNGTDKIYKLTMTNLDTTTVKCNVGGTENSGFTVNRTTGEVTFATAPPTGVNNVEITAYKTFDKLKENILGCTFGTEFSNRMFLSGNKDIKNFYFASGLSDNNDISYFPQKYQYAIKGDDKAVTGMKVQYNKLIVFKEDLTAMVTAATGLDNLASFPISFLNTDVGCDIPGSIQLIENNIVFANTTKGIHMIISTVIADEKAIIPISVNINGDNYRRGLLFEDSTLLRNACSVDWDSKYILNVGEKCYVWDYKNRYNINKPTELKWFLWDNIHANCFAIRDKELIYGHNSDGMLCKFDNTLSDFGLPIKAIFRTKLLDFGQPDYYKTITKIWYTCKANTGSDVDITYISDKGEREVAQSVSSSRLKSFAWDKFSWNNLSWNVQTVAPTFRLKAKTKKVRYFQIELSNSNVDENLSILDLVIQYNIIKRVK